MNFTSVPAIHEVPSLKIYSEVENKDKKINDKIDTEQYYILLQVIILYIYIIITFKILFRIYKLKII